MIHYINLKTGEINMKKESKKQTSEFSYGAFVIKFTKEEIMVNDLLGNISNEIEDEISNIMGNETIIQSYFDKLTKKAGFKIYVTTEERRGLIEFSDDNCIFYSIKGEIESINSKQLKNDGQNSIVYKIGQIIKKAYDKHLAIF